MIALGDRIVVDGQQRQVVVGDREDSLRVGDRRVRRALRFTSTVWSAS